VPDWLYQREKCGGHAQDSTTPARGVKESGHKMEFARRPSNPAATTGNDSETMQETSVDASSKP